jgi:hypothetical protein
MSMPIRTPTPAEVTRIKGTITPAKVTRIRDTLTPSKITPAVVTKIRDTLDLARSGRATLTQLAVAHDLASNASLNGCLGEIRSHIRGMVSPAPLHGTTKDIALGVVSGIVTHVILRNT